MSDTKMYNIGTGGIGAASAGTSVTLEVPGAVQALEALNAIAESLDALSTRPATSPVIDVRIPEIRIPEIRIPETPAATVQVAAPIVNVAPAHAHIRVEIPTRLAIYLGAIPALYLAVGYFVLKYLGS
jgi:hypothetical protein